VELRKGLGSPRGFFPDNRFKERGTFLGGYQNLLENPKPSLLSIPE
jgi:hypothetical protein